MKEKKEFKRVIFYTTSLRLIFADNYIYVLVMLLTLIICLFIYFTLLHLLYRHEHI